METLKLILFLAVLGTLGSAGVLFVWGGYDGRFDDEGTIVIDGSNDQVFRLLLEPEHRTRWVEGVSDSKRVGFGGWERGSRLTETLERGALPLERSLSVVELVEGRSLVLETEEEGVPIRYRYELKAHNTGRESRVLYTVEAQYEGFWPKLLEPLIGGKLFARTKRELETLSGLHLIP